MELDTTQLLQQAVQAQASDVFIVAGLPVSMRINGVITKENDTKLTPYDTSSIVTQIYRLAGNRDMHAFEAFGDDDFSFFHTWSFYVFVSVAYKQEVLCLS